MWVLGPLPWQRLHDVSVIPELTFDVLKSPHGHRQWMMCHLLQESANDDSTVYTVRLETATDRGAGIDDLNSSVLICLMGRTKALLHRIPQVADASQSLDDMDEVCEVSPHDIMASVCFNLHVTS